MKDVFLRIMSISMAFVVLFSTMSFTIDMHYCGDNMVDFSFYQNVDTCGMEKAELVSNCENPVVSQKSCCSDEQLIIEGQDDIKDTFSSFTFEQQVFVTAFTYSYISLYEGTASNEVPYVEYIPSFVKRDVQVLHQTFLI